MRIERESSHPRGQVLREAKPFTTTPHRGPSSRLVPSPRPQFSLRASLRFAVLLALAFSVAPPAATATLACVREVQQKIRVPSLRAEAEFVRMHADAWTPDFRVPVFDLKAAASFATTEAVLGYRDQDDCGVVVQPDRSGAGCKARRLSISLEPSADTALECEIYWEGILVDEIGGQPAGEALAWSGEARPGVWIARIRRSSSDSGSPRPYAPGEMRLKIPCDAAPPSPYTVRFAMVDAEPLRSGPPLVLRNPSAAPELRYEPLPGVLATIRVIGIDGREVASREWLGGRDTSWTLAGLANGIYFARIETGRRVVATERVVVLK